MSATVTTRQVAGHEVERGIAPPTAPDKGGRHSKFPFAEMEVGESVLIKAGTASKKQILYACAHVRKKLGRKFIRRHSTAGTRVWRIG